MKKIILFAAILFAGVSVVKAQDITENEESTVTLNVKLKPVQSIVVQNNTTVDLEYATLANYNTGVSSKVLQDHLKVTTAGAFKIDVEAVNLTATGTDDVIEANTIKIVATDGASVLEGAEYTAEFFLGNDEKTLISTGKGGLEKTFNIQYVGMGDYGYLEKFMDPESGTVYTTQVIYTISPQ